MKTVMRLTLAAVALAGYRTHAEGTTEFVSLHVKEVHRDEDQPTAKGTWYHIKAIAESKTVIYTMTCDEFLSAETFDYVVKCFDLSAGGNYPALKLPKSINFWPDKRLKPARALYDIVSEKEK